MMNYVLIALLVIVVALAARRALRKLRRGGGCCGEHEQVALNPVKDKNRAHYPYRATLEIGGMTCDNCARRVANALNALDGAWATVRFDAKRADVRLMSPPNEAALRRAVSGAGYVVTAYRVEAK